MGANAATTTLSLQRGIKWPVDRLWRHEGRGKQKCENNPMHSRTAQASALPATPDRHLKRRAK